ncbi:MAG: hypothetical protein ACKO96_11795, partial [Flammeovirgaceae bacterium]
QGNDTGYFMEFQNVIEEDKHGNIKPFYYAKTYVSRETMQFYAQAYSEHYSVGIVYKTEIEDEV